MPSWLKSVGKIAIKIGQHAPTIGPIVKAFTPEPVDKVIDSVMPTVDKLDEIGNVIIATEIFSQALTAPIAGPEKLKVASLPTAQILLQFLKLKGLKIDSEREAMFLEGAQDIANGMAKVYNSCKE